MTRSWQYPLIVASLLVISVFGISEMRDQFQASTISLRSQTAQVGGGGATYYISPSGSDTGPGTIDAPWQTLDRAFDRSQSAYLQGGDTLYLRGGIYRSARPDLVADDAISGSAGNPTRISGYQGERASLYLSARVDSGWQHYSGGAGANIWYVN
jgi:hypothetical protein